MATFGDTMSSQAKGEWEHAFSICQKVADVEPSDGQIGVAQLTRQDAVYVPPNSEMVLWTHLQTTSDILCLGGGTKTK